MPHVITELCVGTKDQSCVLVCPVDCIHPARDLDGEEVFAKVEQLYIDPEVCIDCGACVPECPVEAIFMLEELPTQFEKSREDNAQYYREQGS
jgi:NAD-dependent dihydropyrimidine dehydrogenase PreA subunit